MNYDLDAEQAPLVSQSTQKMPANWTLNIEVMNAETIVGNWDWAKGQFLGPDKDK